MKIKFTPDKSQKSLINRTINAYTAAYNYISYYVFATRELNKASLYDQLLYKLYEMYMLGPSMVKCAIGTVSARYELIHEINVVWTQTTFSYDDYYFQWKKDYFAAKNKVSFRTINGWINIPISPNSTKKYFDNKWEFGSAHLRRGPNNWVLSISVTKRKYFKSVQGSTVNKNKTALLVQANDPPPKGALA